MVFPDDSVGEVSYSYIFLAVPVFSVAQNQKVEMDGNKKTEGEATQ